MKIDHTDILVFCGLLVAGIGLYILSWPLVLIFLGSLMAAVGLRRAT